MRAWTKSMSMAIRGAGILALALLATGLPTAAQRSQATTNDQYCSGVVTNAGRAHDFYVISGEDSYIKTVFAQGDYIFLNRGSAQGVRVGDEFLVSRPVKDTSAVKWFTWQPQLARAMGTLWADMGRVKVIQVQSSVSVAEVVFSCDTIQRGDYVRAFTPAPDTPFPEGAIDRFGTASGKTVGMVVFSKHFGQLAGTYDVVYVNLGTTQGVQVGDHIRVFRYQDSTHETPYRTPNSGWMLYGFGSTPVRYTWADLPREVLAHGVVLRVGENAATVLLTATLKDVYLGDYVELK